MDRRKSKKIKVGNTYIGGDARIAVQSMTNVAPNDYDALYTQIKRLEEAGCDIARATVPNEEAVKTFYRLKTSDIKIPLVADIHFDYRMAVEAAEAGADKIRINPGNIGDESKVKKVVDACRNKNIPIRIGVNGGSLERSILKKYGRPSGKALAESALYHASLLEKFDFTNIILAVKSSNVADMAEANELLAQMCEYPLHLGVTEAGTAGAGVIKSAIGIGGTLLRGIGDAIRVSLTADPVEEVKAGKAILKAIGLDGQGGIETVSCPTCGRTKVNLIDLANEFEKRSSDIKVDKKIKVAIMGCAVNGPGEAKECDVGVACGAGEALLFKKGQVVGKIREDAIVETLIEEIKKL